MAVDAGLPVVALHEDGEPVTEQDAVWTAMLRDLTEAVAAVTERIFDLPAIPGTAGDATTERK